MSVIRQDLTTRDWVLIAPSRGKRPHDRTPVRDARPVPAHGPSCPFCFGHASREELATLALVLKKTPQALADALGDPDFNLILHTAPVADETQPYYLWHLQIIPRVTTIAGFELGSGMAISTIKPEETAAIMRDGMPT
jgi:galactose-1-phosphate uridylyltransferase